MNAPSPHKRGSTTSIAEDFRATFSDKVADYLLADMGLHWKDVEGAMLAGASENAKIAYALYEILAYNCAADKHEHMAKHGLNFREQDVKAFLKKHSRELVKLSLPMPMVDAKIIVEKFSFLS